ncbi:unnamed protein product [Effrenium voratum]|nr:unnamed protein product [Effrenium voratum]
MPTMPAMPASAEEDTKLVQGSTKLKLRPLPLPLNVDKFERDEPRALTERAKGSKTSRRLADFLLDKELEADRSPKDGEEFLRQVSNVSKGSSPKGRGDLADIFRDTSRKMLDKDRRGLSPCPYPRTPVSPGPYSEASWSPESPKSVISASWSMGDRWDERERGLSKSRGARRYLAATNSSKFDEWAKKQEQRHEEAKEYEAEVSRKQTCMEDESNILGSLLNDKAVASEVVNKKAVTDLKTIRRIFLEFDQDGSGAIEPREFMPLLSRLLRRPQEDLDKKEVWAVWDQVDADGSGSIDFDEFQRWYTELMGIDILDYGENFIPDDISGDQIMVRNVAKSLGRTILEVEKLYDEFKKLDIDGSNTLEMNEFRILIQKHFAPKGPEVPEHVFKMFWKDFDKDGRGSVSFTGFVKWYLKFMKSEASPMEQYFAYMSATPGSR